MKKVIYIHQYFKIPEEGGALRSYHISRALVKRGIQVEMITSHNHPTYKFNVIDGVNVHYLPVKYSNDFAFKKRYKAFIIFAWRAIILICKLQKPDLVFATSTPLTVGIVALWLKLTKKIPYFFEVRDLWPEAPIQLKIIKSRFIQQIVKKLEYHIYKNSTRVIALSPGIEQGILNSYNKAKVSMIPNMADLVHFDQNRHSRNDKKEFAIGYFGAFGLANNIQFIINIIEECQRANLKIKFILVGDGSHKKKLLNAVSENKNVTILPHKNRSEIKKQMAEVDACLTSFLDFPVLSKNSPNKFFDGLAAWKLSIVNTKGWLKELSESNKCGIYIDAEKPEAFPDLILPFLENNELLHEYQLNAKRLAKEKFSKDMLSNEMCNLILSEIN